MNRKELAKQLKDEVRTIVKLQTFYTNLFMYSDLREEMEENVRDTFITLGKIDKKIISNIKRTLTDDEKEYVEDMKKFGKERMED